MYQDKQKKLVLELEKAVAHDAYPATIVTGPTDFINDKRLCLTIVAFVPVAISTKIIREVIEPLRAIEPEHYFYPAESMHLTIKNVQVINNPPTFTADDVQAVDAMCRDTVPQHQAFSFVLEDVIRFPASLSLMGYSDERLRALVQTLGSNLKIIGVPDNKKLMSDSIFFGNITFCRFAHEPGEAFKQKLRELRTIVIGEVPITKLNLIACNSVCASNSLEIFGTYQLQ
jgi:2'-5' RNA ligase